MNTFDRINAAIEGAEGSIITLVTTLVPWLAPALPAYLTYSHLVADLGVPWLVAGAMAASVEFLGLAAIATAFEAMRHNKRNRAQVRKVSLAFPVGAYVFYIAIVLTVNVVLEWPMTPEQEQYAHIAAIALLTLISAPAFVIAVSRQEQREIENDRPAKPDKPTVIDVSRMTISDIISDRGVSERQAYRIKKAAQNGRVKVAK